MKGKNRTKASKESASAANVLHKPNSLYFKNKRLKLLLSVFLYNLSTYNKKYLF